MTIYLHILMQLYMNKKPMYEIILFNQTTLILFLYFSIQIRTLIFLFSY